ncbi:MAG: NAD(P)-binding domain-containing protein [Synergistaceae bacterium]|jgi:pyrroline-5-carboxylate reductase|nr:NAD(P)-binding domain-containing protein [Synergistaceae bacterium]
MGIVNTDIGFIGTGGIATALARGFCGSEDFVGKVYVYDINVERIRALKALFGEKIVIAASNQDLLYEAEAVFPALRPEVLREVAPTLAFRPANRVIHIAAGIRLSEARQWYAGAQSVVRAVPLPFASRRMGPVVLYGDDDVCRDILSLMGDVVKVPEEKHLDILSSVTALMVPYFELVAETGEWCAANGMDRKDAIDYVCLMNGALSRLMMADCGGDVDGFMRENTTPGGLNEFALGFLRESGAYAPWAKALDQVYERFYHERPA